MIEKTTVGNITRKKNNDKWKCTLISGRILSAFCVP